MSDAEKALELYSLMADRCACSGFADYQAQIYREMVDFMSQYATVDEMTEAIKNSPYYLAPGAALVKDKAVASARAAEEFEMHDVAKVYYDKIAEIDADITEMYTSAFHTTAQNLRNTYERTREAFSETYYAYISLRCMACKDDVVSGSAFRQLRKALGDMTKPSSDFSVLARIDAFRQTIPANDEGYARFVSDIEAFIARGESALDFSSFEEQPIIDEAKEAWKVVGDRKREIKKAHRKYEQLADLKQCKAYAPADASGHYTYR